MVKPAKALKYDESSIDVHLGLDGVRQNRQVYIGTPDSYGIFQCLKEILDNSTDDLEAAHETKRSKEVLVVGTTFEKAKNRCWVYDPGRGIPVGKNAKTNLSTLETIMTTLSAGAKMRGDQKDAAYRHSGGVHGMGVSVTNALAEKLIVWTCRDNQWWTQTYAKGKAVSKVEKCKAPVVPLAPKSQAKRTRGTVVCFEPDFKMFDKGSTLDYKQVRTFLQLKAYLHPTLKLLYNDGKLEKEYHSPGGLEAYVAKKLSATEGAEAIGKPLILSSHGADVALQWSTSDSDLMESFVNGSPTKDGGTHVNGMLKAIKDSLDTYGPKPKKIKRGKSKSQPKKVPYTTEDLCTGLIGVMNVAVSSPRFTTQTKEKLGTPTAVDQVYQAMKPALDAHWNKNKATAKLIIKRAMELRKMAEGASIDKKAAAALRSAEGRKSLPQKLLSARTKNVDKVELFLLEGDSAGGTAGKARNAEYQSVLKLRGKVLAAYGSKSAKLFENKEVLDILRCIGYEPNATGDAKKSTLKLRIGKVILLADPDVDGKHISVLLLSLLQRIMPQLFKQGRVFVVDAPLFNAQHGGKKYFGASLEAVRALLPKGASKVNIQRIKGWGEVQPDVLEDIAFNPKTRRLTKVKAIEGDALKTFISIVGENAAARQELLGL